MRNDLWGVKCECLHEVGFHSLFSLLQEIRWDACTVDFNLEKKFEKHILKCFKDPKLLLSIYKNRNRK